MVCSPQQLGSDAFEGGFGGFGPGSFSGGGGGAFRRFLLLDETTLQGMADLTGGEYYRAEDAEQLGEVFTNLPFELILQKEQHEISIIFALLGALCTAVAATLSLLWHRFP